MTKPHTEYWDNIIREWAESGTVPDSESFWFDEQRHLKLHTRLMPEPYWGDIDNNSVVFLNFNPAGAESENIADTSHHANRDNGSTVCGLMSRNYSEIAREFPLLDDAPDCFPVEYAGAGWWKKRVRWADSFAADSDRKPFAMELCAWHSKKWSRGKYGNKFKALNGYIRDYFGPWLDRALLGSEKRLILCVGAEFADNIFPIIWPDIEDITIETLGRQQPVEGNSRRYRIFRIPGKGYAVCTSARGSNGIPSKTAFGDTEKRIIDKIKNIK